MKNRIVAGPRLAVCAGALSLAATLMFTPSAGAASLGGCQLQGTANFSPGLNSTAKPFSYSFSGGLSGCQSTQAGAPSAGTVSAGKTLSEHVTNSITGATDTVTYQEPVPTGNGGCASSTTAGEALANWSSGGQTVISYATTGALAAVDLSGSVVPSMTLTAVNAAAGDPSTYTINTTLFGGQTATGLVLFQPPDPTACNTATGVTSAGISGTIGLNG